MKILSPAQIQEADKRTDREYGIPSILLMEQAALSAAFLIRQRYPDRKVALYAGPGHNGADTLALARFLFCFEIPLQVYLLPEVSSLKGLCLEQYTMLQNLQIPLFTEPKIPGIQGEWLLVDGLFGTGLNRPLDGMYKKWAEKINRSGFPVFSLDIPSGINGSTGILTGMAVQADMTLCFGPPKIGNILYPGYAYQGDLYQAPLSYPLNLWEKANVKTCNFPVIPEIDRQAYKGSRGYGLVVGGSTPYRGAPGFAAEAALRSGSGYVHLALPVSLVQGIASWLPEGVYHPQQEHKPGILSEEHLEGLASLTQDMDWVIIGPGLGRDPSTGRLLERLLPRIKAPVILDGDALALLANRSGLIQSHPHPIILTPHPGEAALLLNLTVEKILQDPLESLKNLVKKFETPVLLKQPHSIFASPDSGITINLSGSPSLATAGSGDILCGVIAALLGRGLDSSLAVPTAALIHGLAGELLEDPAKGAEGTTASDILDILPHTFRYYRENRNSLRETGNGRILPLDTRKHS